MTIKTLKQKGIMSPNDVDKIFTSGLGMRYFSFYIYRLLYI